MTYHFNYEDLTENVVSVELINYNNPDAKILTYHYGSQDSKLLSFVFEEMTVLEALDAEHFDDFFQQLSQVEILYEWYSYNSPKDICIRLVCENGDFEVLSCDYKNHSFYGYIGRYNTNGDVIEYIGTFEGLPDFENLINTFFTTELPVN